MWCAVTLVYGMCWRTWCGPGVTIWSLMGLGSHWTTPTLDPPPPSNVNRTEALATETRATASALNYLSRRKSRVAPRGDWAARRHRKSHKSRRVNSAIWPSIQLDVGPGEQGPGHTGALSVVLSRRIVCGRKLGRGAAWSVNTWEVVKMRGCGVGGRDT